MKIEIFCRHAFSSLASRHKARPIGFSYEKCYRNLLDTFDASKGNLTFFFDGARGPLEDHFLVREKKHPIIEIREGSEAGSFLKLLDYVLSLEIDPETIVYFLEDDYLHHPGWMELLFEAFEIPGVTYATLYDHRDKYTSYPKLTSQIFVTRSCHWRSTPSTTNTFATQLKTLRHDLAIHQKFSRGREISADHDKFLKLQKRGALLVSSIPGFSTHAEPAFASPCTAWETLLT